MIEVEFFVRGVFRLLPGTNVTKALLASCAAQAVPGECAGMFTTSCCLHKWSVDECLWLGIFALWPHFKASHSFPCNLNSAFTAHPHVISVLVNVPKARLVRAVLFSPSAWLAEPAFTGKWRSLLLVLKATCGSLVVHSKMLSEVWHQ